MLHNVMRFLSAWWQDRLALYHLKGLDDRLLDDVGADRSGLADFVRNHATH